jgi:serine/threonine protein kinase
MAGTSEPQPPSTRPTFTGGPVLGINPAALSELATRLVAPLEHLPEAAEQAAPGQRLGDFFLMETLGTGSFATVFLAMQISLGRQVALKVARSLDNEALTLASLEHDHIVPVYSETIDQDRHLHLLCMKFVPGTTLDRVMGELAKRPTERWSGQAILDAIDRLSRHEVMFDLAALRDREMLAECDFIEAVCWLGARLAEALAHAHSRGVLHRDIKPANILLNHYGRPMLSDFNLAHCSRRGLEGGHFGGTLQYMSPEHLMAFLPAGDTSHDVVDTRSDIYSLGVVLYELLTGQPLFGKPISGRSSVQLVQELAEERRSRVPSPRQVQSWVPEVVDRVIRRCLDPDPTRRYQKAEDLAQALEGCRQLENWEREFPTEIGLTRASHHSPMLMVVILGLIPHLLGSLVNITYNTVAIVKDLTAAQQHVFNVVLLSYNAVMYPLLVWLFCRVMLPVIHVRTALAGPEPLDAEEVARQRRRALGLPMLAIILSVVGWVPGGVLFPLCIHLLAGPLSSDVFFHFLVSFTISGLIATTYTYFGLQGFVLRILYPRLWIDPRSPSQEARRELGPIEGRLRMFQFAAGLIPLSGAILVLSIGGEHLSLVFRILIVGLIGLGMAGFGGALLASRRVSKTLSVLLGSNPGGSRARVTAVANLSQ